MARLRHQASRHVPGTDAVLFVDDGRPNEDLPDATRRRSQTGRRDQNNQYRDEHHRPRRYYYDGEYFYVVGSQSKSKGADQAGLARFKFDAANQRAAGTQAASGLKKFLADNVAELRGMENTKYNDGGINVEGIAWDPQNKRLLLGLRSPVVDGHALVVPLKLRDPKAALSFDNLEVEGRKAIRLPLGGAGIRVSSTTNPAKRSSSLPVRDRILREWISRPGNGAGTARASLRELQTFDRRLKPEGITRVSTGARDFVFIVFDTSGYAATD